MEKRSTPNHYKKASADFLKATIVIHSENNSSDLPSIKPEDQIAEMLQEKRKKDLLRQLEKRRISLLRELTKVDTAIYEITTTRPPKYRP